MFTNQIVPHAPGYCSLRPGGNCRMLKAGNWQHPLRLWHVVAYQTAAAFSFRVNHEASLPAGSPVCLEWRRGRASAGRIPQRPKGQRIPVSSIRRSAHATARRAVSPLQHRSAAEGPVAAPRPQRNSLKEDPAQDLPEQALQQPRSRHLLDLCRSRLPRRLLKRLPRRRCHKRTRIPPSGPRILAWQTGEALEAILTLLEAMRTG